MGLPSRKEGFPTPYTIVRRKSMRQFTVSEKPLDDLIDNASRTLVGKAMKRFEIFDNKEDVKKAIKELVYENYRVLKALIKSFSCGVQFKTKPRGQE